MNTCKGKTKNNKKCRRKCKNKFCFNHKGGSLCDGKVEEYHRVCDPVWKEDCKRTKSKFENKRLSKNIKKCKDLRVNFMNNCIRPENRDTGHYGAIERMKTKELQCNNILNPPIAFNSKRFSNIKDLDNDLDNYFKSTSSSSSSSSRFSPSTSPRSSRFSRSTSPKSSSSSRFSPSTSPKSSSSSSSSRFARGGKKIKRTHKGINKSTGRLKKGYKYGKKLKSGLRQIIKVN